MSLLDEFQQGTGTFSPLALSSEKKFARAVAPGMAGILGQIANATGQLSGDIVRTGGVLKATGIKEAGDTLRQRLVNDAQTMLEEMRQTGATKRTGMQEAGASYRTDLTGKYQTSLQRDKYRLDENLADNLMLMKTRALDRYNQTAYPGGVGATLDAIEGERKKSRLSDVLESQSTYSDDDDYMSGTW